MKCSIIATGTELIIGQTINRNAPEISKKLISYGFDIHHHLTVSDQAKEILWAIEQSSLQSDLIVITGGLGPTSDDLTRNVVADWANRELKWDENSWHHVCERMQSRGFAVKEIQKQQCYFPEGSIIVKNFKGTANAFYLNAKNKIFIVLPGPPAEIEAVWANGFANLLAEVAIQNQLDPFEMKIWDTMGLGESDVANIVEKIINDFFSEAQTHLYLKEKIEIGYRVHLPYVEVKLLYRKSIQGNLSQLIQKIDEQLSSITFFRDLENVKDEIIKKLNKSQWQQITIKDCASQGRLLFKLSNDSYFNEVKIPISYQQFEPEIHQPNSSTKNLNSQFEFGNLYIQIQTANSNSWLIRINDSEKVISFPYSSALMSDRNRQFAIEMCLIEILRFLSTEKE